ncbi:MULTISPECIES: class I SAM-dependent methyltransferase [Thiorhodovibrio]|uniref:class I SAM-dependent methyltransferase n=1 Tax=Thiorhodovibrio TaxID=61593 RepID=UPI001912D0A0|nr:MULTISPECIES: class I SAM-dependent methyltransferase [Thiorhodovibrio]MBK5967371.1 SAM-dependent methyltransferase [Thiorhodovibrio winogradskyi]WPL14336.1 Demethylrebeccamycin-D-glucose O-methyltransferase [Thiorhodovibrio litoralis]
MDDMQLLIDLHKDADRQGPGGDAESEQALRLAMHNMALLHQNRRLQIADIGCGTGASTLVLARLLDAEITAVDFLRDFLDVLDERAREAGVGEKIQALCHGMEDLPFEPNTFDLIWSEGAIYNIGFEKGVGDWRRYLKAGGVLAVSEITWTSATRPAEVQAHWQREYPQIDTAAAKLQILEQQGYAPIGYFILPQQCWIDQYYRPMQARFPEFLERHQHSEAAQAIVAAEEQESALYERYRDYYSYGFYIARKLGD